MADGNDAGPILTLLPFRPGVVTDDTTLSAEGFWVQANKVRFRRERAEIMGGYASFFGDVLDGTCRKILSFSDYSGNVRVLYGTSTREYVYAGTTLTDITPEVVAVSTTLGTPPFSVTAGSPIVAANFVSNHLFPGDTFRLYGSISSVGGLTLIGNFVASTVSSGNFTFSALSNATATTTGGGTASINSPRFSLGANPFSTVSGSVTVTVSQATYSPILGQRVSFGGATAFNGLTITGFYAAVSTGTPNFFTINASSAASGSGSGGGSSVAAAYDIPPGRVSAVAAAYGGGGYGAGGYGSGTAISGFPWLRTWALASYLGGSLGNPRGLSIYQWQDNIAQRATIIPNAPAQVNSIVVTPENYLLALGCTDTDSTYNPKAIRWPDNVDYTLWTPASTNTAGRLFLASGNYNVAGLVSQGQTLVWTDTSLYGLQYQPNSDTGAYLPIPLGTNCGLIGANAVVDVNGRSFWMSNNGKFFAYVGGAPQDIINPNRNYVFDALSADQSDKIYACSLAQFGEVWWFYPTVANSGENAAYIVYNYVEDHWTIGTYDRTAMIDRASSTYPFPIATDAEGRSWSQETGYSANGAAFIATLVSAAFDLSNGDRLMLASGMVPDIDFGPTAMGALTVTPSASRWPNGPLQTLDAQTITQSTERVDFNIEGRQMQLTFQSADSNTFWRLGNLRSWLLATGKY